MTKVLRGGGMYELAVAYECLPGSFHMSIEVGNHVTLGQIKLEDLTVLKRSPDLLKNVKIGQDQLQLIMKHILFYRGCGPFGQVT